MRRPMFLEELKEELKKGGLAFTEDEVVAGMRVHIAFPKEQLAVFVSLCSEGCGCPEHYMALQPPEEEAPSDTPWGKTPTQCQARLERETHRLEDAKWKVLRFWEHDVDRDIDAVVDEIRLELEDLQYRASGQG